MHKMHAVASLTFDVGSNVNVNDHALGGEYGAADGLWARCMVPTSQELAGD